VWQQFQLASFPARTGSTYYTLNHVHERSFEASQSPGKVKMMAYPYLGTFRSAHLFMFSDAYISLFFCNIARFNDHNIASSTSKHILNLKHNGNTLQRTTGVTLGHTWWCSPHIVWKIQIHTIRPQNPHITLPLCFQLFPLMVIRGGKNTKVLGR